MLQGREVNLSPRTNAYAVHTAAPVKESNYIKQQKWSRDGKKMMNDTYNSNAMKGHGVSGVVTGTKRLSMSKNDEANRSNVLGRDSEMAIRRSQMLVESSSIESPSLLRDENRQRHPSGAALQV